VSIFFRLRHLMVRCLSTYEASVSVAVLIVASVTFSDVFPTGNADLMLHRPAGTLMSAVRHASTTHAHSRIGLTAPRAAALSPQLRSQINVLITEDTSATDHIARLDSRLFALWALLSAVCTAAFMERNRFGLFRASPAPLVSLFASSGEKSVVDALSGLLGDDDLQPKKSAPPPPPVPVASSAPPSAETLGALAALPLDDARRQVEFLRGLKLRKFGAAIGRLGYYAVTMQQLERVGLSASALGVVESDADLETVKNYTAGVFVGFSLLAVIAGFAIPGPTGATLTYLFGAVPLVFLGIGSTVPGLIVKGITAIESGKEGRGGDVDAEGVNRRVRHEAAHFLLGYILGLPVCGYNVEPDTARVAFFATPRGDLQPGDRFTKEELDRLCVVSLAGAVGETLTFSKATGGGQDLRLLQRAFVTAEERLNPNMQMDKTRWGALKARELLKSYDGEYQRLCRAFAQKLPVPECILVIESQ